MVIDQQYSLVTKKRHFRGMMCLALAMFVFVSVNAFVKTMDESYPIIEIVFFRNFFAIIPCMIVLCLQKNLNILKVSNRSTHFFRALFGIVSLCCLFESILLLPLAEATVFMFTSSIFVMALAFPMLGEKIGWARLAAVVVGFVGVLIVSGPAYGVLNWGAVFGLVSAVIEAAIMVHNRKLSVINHPLAITLYYLVFASVISCCFLPFFWQMPTRYDVCVLIALGIGGGIGQYLVTVAYAYAPAGLLSPILYTAMIWSLCYGVLLFQEIPSVALIIGGGLILLANFFVILQENKKISQETV